MNTRPDIPKTTRVLGVIPARYASTRLPGKALLEIGGKPMIQRVWERAAACGALEHVVIATDDERIRAAAADFGAEAVMTRADHPSGTDRLAEVAAASDAEVIVNIQGDEPFLEPSVLERLVAPFAEHAAEEMTTVAVPVFDPEIAVMASVTKVVRGVQGYALYFSRAALPHYRDGLPVEVRSQQSELEKQERPGGVKSAADARPGPAPWLKHLGLYAYRRETLLRLAALPQTPLELAEKLEQLRALEHGIHIRVVVVEHDSIGVDTPEDLDEARRLASLVDSGEM